MIGKYEILSNPEVPRMTTMIEINKIRSIKSYQIQEPAKRAQRKITGIY